MLYGKIRGLDKRASRLVLGTDSLWLNPFHRVFGRLEKCSCLNILDVAVEVGINTFDTAAVYGSEPLIGSWIRSRGCRDEVVVVTKCGHPSLITGRSRTSLRAVTADIHRSLRRLDLSEIDVLLMHYDDDEIEVSEIVGWLEMHRVAGNIRCYGVSNWDGYRIREAHRCAADNGASGLAAVSAYCGLVEWTQPMWPKAKSLAGRQGEETLEYCSQHGISILAWSPLSAGYLSGRTTHPRGWVRKRRYSQAQRIFDCEDNRKIRQRVETLADRHGVGSAEIVLAYLLGSRKEVFPIIGCGTAEHIRRNAAAVSVDLSMEEMRWLDVQSVDL